MTRMKLDVVPAKRCRYTLSKRRFTRAGRSKEDRRPSLFVVDQLVVGFRSIDRRRHADRVNKQRDQVRGHGVLLTGRRPSVAPVCERLDWVWVPRQYKS